MKNIIILISILLLFVGLSNCSEEYDDKLLDKTNYTIKSIGDSIVITSKWSIYTPAYWIYEASDTTLHFWLDGTYTDVDIKEDWFTVGRIDSTSRRSFYVKVDANTSKEVREILLEVKSGPLAAGVSIIQEAAE